MQWFAVILTGVATFAYIVFRIYKKYKNKNNKCTGCAYSGNCFTKQMKDVNQIPEKRK
ncbi:MAG: hypothetical protein LBF04_02000 [Prevotellaceae bacterium]|jgi:hypothetical protein|nr:hypothetical protein [Prevotellaceae bacterium]